jgi:hypothetical protein
MGFDSRFERLPRLYVKALVLKEACKASLSLSRTRLGIRKSQPFITGRY